MKEYYINVYYRHGRYWHGIAYEDKWRSDAAANKYRIYRIHVRLK